MTSFLGKNLWQEVSRRAAGGGRKYVAVPYYSSDDIVSCGNGDTLIVNATDACISAGQTSAVVLVDAARRGARIFSHANLHAKILLFEDCAFVSSANLSVNSTELREAGVFLQSAAELSRIRVYIDLLIREACQLDRDELQRLSSLAVLRSRRSVGSKPSLLEALELDSPVLREVAFGVAGSGHDLRKAEVVAAANNHELKLPKGWTWFESPHARGVLKRLESACVGLPLVSFEARYENGILKEFLEHEDEARPFLHAFRLNDVIVSVFGFPSRAPPVDLSAPSDELISTLNRGIEEVRKVDHPLLGRISREEGVISVDDMRRLFALGTKRSPH